MWFLFSLALVPSLSTRQLFKVKTSLFQWKHHPFSLKSWSFHIIFFFEQKKEISDDFFMTTWERENKSERKKEPQIPHLYCNRLTVQSSNQSDQKTNHLILKFSHFRQQYQFFWQDCNEKHHSSEFTHLKNAHTVKLRVLISLL